MIRPLETGNQPVKKIGRRTNYMVGTRLDPDTHKRMSAWAERNGYSRAGGIAELVRFALDRCAPEDTLPNAETLLGKLGDHHDVLDGIQDHLCRIDARLDALGSLAAMAPLLLSHWYAHETQAREPDETPEQAEERMWLAWAEAGEIEWDARRRRVDPTAEEAALEQGEVEEREDTELLDDGDLPRDEDEPEATAPEPPTAPAPARPARPVDPDDLYRL